MGNCMYKQSKAFFCHSQQPSKEELLVMHYAAQIVKETSNLRTLIQLQKEPEKQEEDDDLSTHELQCGVSRGKSALYRRKLVFDCINEALRCKLDMVTKQSFYLFAPSLSILVNLSVPKILDGVCKQINEWNRIAMNRYMDDMMKREINDTLGWGWSTSGHEMDVILINIEDFILGDLVGETIKLLLNM
mgnify:CR=1 FL=1